jgi:hypothetical protein
MTGEYSADNNGEYSADNNGEYSADNNEVLYIYLHVQEFRGTHSTLFCNFVIPRNFYFPY